MYRKTAAGAKEPRPRMVKGFFPTEKEGVAREREKKRNKIKTKPKKIIPIELIEKQMNRGLAKDFPPRAKAILIQRFFDSVNNSMANRTKPIQAYIDTANMLWQKFKGTKKIPVDQMPKELTKRAKGKYSVAENFVQKMANLLGMEGEAVEKLNPLRYRKREIRKAEQIISDAIKQKAGIEQMMGICSKKQVELPRAEIRKIIIRILAEKGIKIKSSWGKIKIKY